MSYGIRKDFYHSKAWNKTRLNIWYKQGCLCAMCNKPVYVDGITEYIPKDRRKIGIVHHIKELNDINVQNNEIALDESNLIGLCKDCHEEIHHINKSCRKGLMFDENGNLIEKP